MTFDPLYFKSQFPLFSQAENRSLVYLDNAATTQKPQCVIDAITYFYTTLNGNAQRASHRLARAATDMVEHTRELAAEFMGANHANEIVFTAGATEALNIVAHGLGEFCRAGDEIVLSTGEHHANLLPWQRMAEQRQCRLVFLPNHQSQTHHGQPNMAQWSQVINERTRILALSAASNVLGDVMDLSLLAQIKQRFPAIIIVLDASQIACHIDLQAAHWQCDFMVCSAHKFYGPTGIGLLYAKPIYLQSMPPLLLGGEMVREVNLQRSVFMEGVQRFEAGTSSLAAIAGLQACLQFWQQQDRHEMSLYEQQLTQYLYTQCRKLCDATGYIRLLNNEASPSNIGIAVMVANGAGTADSISMADVAQWLDESNIAVRVGQHCAQTLWKTLAPIYGSDNGLRLSLAAYNTHEDVDRFIAALEGFFSALGTVDSSADSSSVFPPVTSTSSLIVDDLSHLQWEDLVAAHSWQQRFKLLLQWGKAVQTKPAIRQPQYVVKGCESQVWVKHQCVDGQHYFLIDSDANLIKGLSALLLFLCNEKTSAEINAINIQQHYQTLGLQKHLSESRMNGFLAIVKTVEACL